MTPADSPRRIHLLTALLIVGTFAAGAVTGAGIVRWFAPAAPRAESPPPLPAARLPREIRLTPEQDEKARAIGERYRPELDKIASELRPRVRSVQDRMEAELRAILSPEQRTQLAEVEERRRHPPVAGVAPPPPGPPPPAGEPRGEAGAGPGARPPPEEAVEACAHLDADRLCRFTHDGREIEGSCRRPPNGQGPLSCAPDRSLEPPPREPRRP